MSYIVNGLQLYLNAKDYTADSKSVVWKDDNPNNLNGHSANLTGTFAFNSSTSGWTGTSLSLDGTDDGVLIPYSTDFDYKGNNFTFELYLKNKSNLNKIYYYFMKANSGASPYEDSWWLQRNETGEIAFGISDGTTWYEKITTNKLNDTTNYHHIIMMRDGINLKLYVDNVLWGTLDITGKIMPTFAQPIGIGRSSLNKYYTDISVQSVRVYNRALTTDEIQKNYIDATQSYYITNGLQLYLDAKNYPNNSISNIWSDKSGIGNNATLNNFAFNGVTSGWIGNALAFDGTDDYAVLTSAIPATSFTFEIQYTLPTDNNDRMILDQYGKEYGFGIEALGNTLYFNGSMNVSLTKPLGSKIVEQLIYDGTNLYIYIDNVLKIQAPKTFTGIPQLVLGRFGTGGYFYNGKISMIRTYNRALTLDELNQNYANITYTPYVSSGLQLYLDAKDYTADSKSTTWVDKSENNINGTLANFALNGTTSGWTGKSLTFDGVDDRVLVGKNAKLEPSNAITIELSINKHALVKYAKLLWYGDNNSAPWGSYGFERDPNNQNINFHLATNGSYSQLAIPITNIPDNTDLHIVASYNGSIMAVYVNNKLITTTSKTGTITYSNAGLYIGDCNVFGSMYTGKIYFVRIYNRALTTDEITQNYQDAIYSPYVTNGLQLYLDANDYPANSTSTIWTDKSGNSNNGTIAGNTTFDGTALVLDGVDDQVNLPIFNVNTSQVTMEMMVNIVSTANNTVLYSNEYNGSWRNSIWLNTWFTRGFPDTTRDDFQITPLFPTNQWLHLVFIYDSVTNLKTIFVNGTQYLQKVVSPANEPLSLSDTNIHALGYSADGTRLKGSIKLFRYYNRALTNTEIQKNYSNATTIQSETVNILSVTINPNPVYVGNAFMISVEAV